MSIAVRQQINLYQPLFRQERKLFTAATVALGLAIVAATLLAMWAFAAFQVAALEREVEVVREQHRTQERLVAAAGALRAQRANPQLVNDRIKQVSAQLAERTRALELLHSGAAGDPLGFAARLAALARQQQDGVWLDHIALSGDAAAMQLSGGALDPAYVPRYLQALAGESALTGARFDEFIVERAAKDAALPGVRFHAGTAALSAERKEAAP